MKLDKIHLSWFRGAAESGTLELDSKNLVVYGSNGSGKSTFVDGLEYIINRGKIRHLSHEYSGRRQELGVRNTHAPEGTSSRCEIYFDDGSFIAADIKPSGNFDLIGEPKNLPERVQNWAIENHLLRQDEVSDFIHLTKGEKYSVLLPLLGLEGLEFSAENFQTLREHVYKQSAVRLASARLGSLVAGVQSRFGSIRVFCR
jgi:energy-coupling factor transporter ATP-binding protein EcfA2